MSGKKKSTNTLIIVFVILLALVIVNQLSRSKKGERTFRKDLIEAAAEDITGMSLYVKATGYQEIALKKQGEDWKIEYDGKSYRGDKDLINGMVDELTTITPDRLIAKTKDSWGEYDVTDTTGTRVVIQGGKKKLGEIFIGRFAYNQATRKPTTYVRMSGDKETYAVEAYLSMTFSRDVNGLRDKSIFRGNRADITGVTFNYPGDSSFTLRKQETKWMLNDSPADSAATAQYLSSITYTVGNEFADNFAPTAFSGQTYQMVIERLNMPVVEITAYVDEYGTILKSSANPETYFTSGSSNIFGKLFKGPSNFSPKTE